MRFKNICKDQNRKDHSCYPADTELDQKEKRCFLFFHISGDQIIDRVDKLIVKPKQKCHGSTGYSRDTICECHTKSSDKLYYVHTVTSFFLINIYMCCLHTILPIIIFRLLFCLVS